MAYDTCIFQSFIQYRRLLGDSSENNRLLLLVNLLCLQITCCTLSAFHLDILTPVKLLSLLHCVINCWFIIVNIIDIIIIAVMINHQLAVKWLCVNPLTPTVVIGVQL